MCFRLFKVVLVRKIYVVREKVRKNGIFTVLYFVFGIFMLVLQGKILKLDPCMRKSVL